MHTVRVCVRHDFHAAFSTADDRNRKKKRERLPGHMPKVQAARRYG